MSPYHESHNKLADLAPIEGLAATVEAIMEDGKKNTLALSRSFDASGFLREFNPVDGDTHELRIMCFPKGATPEEHDRSVIATISVTSGLVPQDQERIVTEYVLSEGKDGDKFIERFKKRRLAGYKSLLLARRALRIARHDKHAFDERRMNLRVAQQNRNSQRDLGVTEVSDSEIILLQKLLDAVKTTHST